MRLDFVSAGTPTGETVVIEELGLALEPLKFMEFSPIDTAQAALLSRDGACVVNIPAPERYAVHKLIVHGERPVTERVESAKDIEQAAALAQRHLLNGQAERFDAARRNAPGRGRGWRKRAEEGRRALLARHPELAARESWGAKS